MNDIIIFGAGQIAATVAAFIDDWQCARVHAFVVDQQFKTSEELSGVPIVSSDEMVARFPPSRFQAFVAVGYQELNSFRAQKIEHLAELGYTLPSFVNPHRPKELSVGRNSLVVPDKAFIEPFVSLGSNVFVWNATSLSHHVRIGDDCWLSNGTLIGGNVTVGRGSFLGLGVIVNNRVDIGSGCLVGSGAIVGKNVPDGAALLPPSTLPSSANAKYAQALLK